MKHRLNHKDKLAVGAVKIIAEHCKEIKNCEKCVLEINGGCFSGLALGYPANWLMFFKDTKGE